MGHNIYDFDLSILGRVDERFKNVLYLDTFEISGVLFPMRKEYSVESLYHDFVSPEYKETHRALDDARDESVLFEKFKDIELIKKQAKREGKLFIEFL